MCRGEGEKFVLSNLITQFSTESFLRLTLLEAENPLSSSREYAFCVKSENDEKKNIFLSAHGTFSTAEEIV